MSSLFIHPWSANVESTQSHEELAHILTGPRVTSISHGAIINLVDWFPFLTTIIYFEGLRAEEIVHSAQGNQCTGNNNKLARKLPDSY